VIKNCFDFSLKNVVKAMENHGFIKTKLNSDCQNGLTASINAWKVYNNSNIENKIDSPIIQDIIKYNRFDVEALQDILNYFRK
jgi:hypothetical protein